MDILILHFLILKPASPQYNVVWSWMVYAKSVSTKLQ